MSEVCAAYRRCGPALCKNPLRGASVGSNATGWAHLLAELRPEGLLERSGEDVIRPLRRPSVVATRPMDGCDSRDNACPVSTCGGNSVRSQPATQHTANGEPRSNRAPARYVSLCIGRQSQRLGTSPRARRSQVHGHAHCNATPRRYAHASLRLTAYYRPVMYVCRGSHHNR